MSSWAFIIGIDDYAGAPLPGSTNDALQVCEWLTRDGGPVPLSNVYLCLSPRPAVLPPAIANVGWTGDATMNTLVQALAHLWRRPGGDDVYVYFAGHGAFVPGQLLQQFERVLLASDFTAALPTNSIKVDDLLDAFAGSNFTNQFFFLDACADVQSFRSGVIPSPPVRDYSRHVNQFVLHATSPGAMAAQLTRGSSLSRGVYTTALLEALGGTGAAKRYDHESNTYHVRWSELATYVIARVKRQAILPMPTSIAIQWPVEDGQHDDTNPILATFPANHFTKVTLSVTVQPTAAGSATKLEVSEPGKRVPIHVFTPCTELPVLFALDPRLYFIFGSADGYVPAKESWSAELYEDGALTVTFTPGAAPPPPPPPSPAPAQPPPAFEPPEFGPGGRLAKEHLRYLIQPDDRYHYGFGRWTSLEVTTRDPLAHLDIVDLNGKVVVAGQGRLEAPDLKPGAYYARCRSPEGVISSQLVNVIQDEHPRIPLAPPAADQSPAMCQVIAKSGFQLDQTGNLDVSEALGPIASGRLSTVLALAGLLATYPPKALSWGRRLRSLGLSSLDTFIPATETSGVYVLLADEQPKPAGLHLPLTAIDVGLSRVDGERTPIPLRIVGEDNVIAEGGTASHPGAHWLTVRVPSMRAARFTAHLLPNRVTLFVFSRMATGNIGVFQYFLPAHPTPDSDAKRAARAVRALEVVQRRVLAGLFGDVTNPETLVDFEFGDPMWILFGGYLSLRARIADGSRDFDPASKAAGWLIERYGDLPDGYIIRAGIAEATERGKEAAADYTEALSRGLPVFVGGLARLSAAIERYNLTQPNSELVAQVVRERIPSSLWPVHAAH